MHDLIITLHEQDNSLVMFKIFCRKVLCHDVIITLHEQDNSLIMFKYFSEYFINSCKSNSFHKDVFKNFKIVLYCNVYISAYAGDTYKKGILLLQKYQ